VRIGSLFSGCGGLDIAAEQVFDGKVMWQCEVDRSASKVLQRRWPDVPNLGDITAVEWKYVEPVHVLVGGFPCQDVSVAGHRRGLRPDTRSGLWEHMAYAIEQLRPEIVVIENVSGILSANAHGEVESCEGCMGDSSGRHMRALGAVLADLAEMGFDAEWGSVRASDVGAPHRRERVFIVAANPSGRQLPRSAIKDYRLPVLGECSLLPTPSVVDMGRGKTPEDWDAWTQRMRDRHGNGNGHGKSLHIEAQRMLPTPTAQDGSNNAVPSQFDRNSLPLNAAVTADFGPYTAAVRRWEQVIGRLAPNPTTLNKNGTPRLNAAFAEFMMGLPEGWVTDAGVSQTAALKILGNGVVPQQAELALSLLLPRLLTGRASYVMVEQSKG